MYSPSTYQVHVIPYYGTLIYASMECVSWTKLFEEKRVLSSKLTSPIVVIEMAYGSYGLGATTVGLRVRDGIVLASEKRLSYGGFIFSRAVRKAFKLNNRFGIAFAGLFADIQALFKIMQMEIKYYELTTGRRMTTSSAVKLLANILYAYKFMPFLSEVLFGGRDEDGYHLYVLDALGSSIEDNFMAVGSGAPVALGLIEDRYSENLSLNEAEKLAIEAIRVASRRDAFSGDGIDLVIIDHKDVVEKTVPI